MQPDYQSKALFKGALILTVAALITKILSAVYRIPFQNIVGDTGFYIYQQVYPIYGVALVLSTTGFPVIISKLYSEKKNQSDQLGMQRILLVSFVFLMILGILSFLLLFYGAERIAQLMNDPKLSVLIRVISVFFLTIPATALFRGYFQGEGQMAPTAYSQVGEQLIRVGTILITASVFISAQYNLYMVGAGAVFGSVTGGIVGSLILFTFIWVKKDYKRIQFQSLHLKSKETGRIVKILLTQGFAVCVSSMLLLLLQLADSLNLYSLLLFTGVDGNDAKVIKGVYDRGQPLIQLGTVVATSMSLSLVPLIASEKIKTSVIELHGKIQLAIRISLIVGLGATVGLMAIIKPTNIMLYENSDGSDVLFLLCVTILLSSCIITLNSIFQGLGYSIYPAIMVLVGFAMKYGLNILLVPTYASKGAAWASIITLGFILIILYWRVQYIMEKSLVTIPFIIKTLCAAFSMLLILKGFLFISDNMHVLESRRGMATIQALFAVMAGGITYLFVIVRTKIFTMEELTLLPFGSKIMYLLPKRNRR